MFHGVGKPYFNGRRLIPDRFCVIIDRAPSIGPIDRRSCVVVSVFLLGKLASLTLTTRTTRPWRPASGPSYRQPPHRIGRFFAFADSAHHGGMMRGGGGGAEGGMGEGGEVFCSMRFLASIDHGGRRLPTAAMKPHSRRLSIQQSANILGNRLVSLKLEKVIINYVY